jgi:spore maturation protein CgeB
MAVERQAIGILENEPVLVRTRSGSFSLRMKCRDGSEKALHSLYDPEKEAVALVDNSSCKGGSLIVVLGLGLGYHVVELGRRYPDAELVVVEASDEIYEMARKCEHMDAVADKATFLVGLSQAAALRKITRLQLQSGLKSISIFRFPAALSVFGDYYSPIEAKLEKAREVKLWERLKYAKFGQEKVQALLIDFDYFLTHEAKRALEAMEHQVSTVRIRKGENGEAIVSKLIKKVLETRPDFLLTINHLGFDEDGVLTSFLESIEMPVASWYVDSPNLIVKEFKANVSPFTTLFLWDKGYVKDMEAIGFEAVSYLPLATDERVFRPLHRSRKKGVVSPCDAGFVGHSMVEPVRKRLSRVAAALHPVVEQLTEQPLQSRASFQELLTKTDGKVRARIETLDAQVRIDLEAAVLWKRTQRYRLQCVERLVGFDAHIHGDDGWRELLNNHGSLRPVLAYYDELPLFYNLCKINFNATSYQMGAAVNQRVFDVPACGAFLLTDHQEALEEAFDIGREVIVFEDPEEIPDLVRFYLDNPQKRQAIAASGRERVLAEHTYRHRLHRIVEQMRSRYG